MTHKLHHAQHATLYGEFAPDHCTIYTHHSVCAYEHNWN